MCAARPDRRPWQGSGRGRCRGVSERLVGADQATGTQVAAGARVARMFGDEGQKVLDDLGPGLFPDSVRPSFLRLLWLVMIVLAVLLAVVLTTVAGKLS